MPHTPDDPTRYQEGQFEALLVEAHARIFEIAREQCEEIRQLLAEANMEETEEREALAKRVSLNATQYENTDGMSVKVRIFIDGTLKVKGLRKIVHVQDNDISAELRPGAARAVFRTLEPEFREAIAEYMASRGHRQAEDDLDETDRYDDLQEMHRLVEELRERIIDGELPIPPPLLLFRDERDRLGQPMI